jgi:hypothetical protein
MYGNWVPIRSNLQQMMPFCFHILAVCGKNLWCKIKEDRKQQMHFGNTHLAIRLVLVMAQSNPELIRVTTSHMEGTVWRNDTKEKKLLNIPPEESTHLDYSGYTWHGLSKCNHLDCKFEFSTEFCTPRTPGEDAQYLDAMTLVEAIRFLFSKRDIGQLFALVYNKLTDIDTSVRYLVIS